MRNLFKATVITAGLTAVGATASVGPAAGAEPAAAAAHRPVESPGALPSDRILSNIADPDLNAVTREVLARNPEIAAARSRAEALLAKAPQVSALPDPIAAVTAYLSSPETRVGPQRLMVGLSQKLPWFGKLGLKKQAALHAAAAARADVEALRLKQTTEVRRLYYELAFVAAYRQVLAEDRATLGHYEELARSRYASGVGLGQAVIKIQAELTRDDARLLDLDARRAELAAALNALRDRPDGAPVVVAALPDLPEMPVAENRLREEALTHRPEITAAGAAISRSEAMVALAKKGYKPDVTVGLTYAVVGGRSDPAGLLNPPEDNGQDVLGLTAGINLPIHRKKLAAGVEEAARDLDAAVESRRSVIAAIDGAIDDLAYRVPVTWDRLRLFEDVLIIQAREALHSAEAGYSSGTQNALDLLDAERVLLDVRTAAHRARADYAIAVARLEGAVGAPLPLPDSSPKGVAP